MRVQMLENSAEKIGWQRIDVHSKSPATRTQFSNRCDYEYPGKGVVLRQRTQERRQRVTESGSANSRWARLGNHF